MSGFSRFIVGRKKSPLIAVFSILISGALLGVSGYESSTATGSTDQLPDNKQSTRAVEIQQSFPGDALNPAVILFEKVDQTNLTENDIKSISLATSKLASIADGEIAPAPQVAQSRKSAIYILPLQATANADAVADTLDDARTILSRALPAEIVVSFTGGAGFQADVSRVFDGANVKLLGTTAAVVAILLLFTYRSPWLWIIPLVVVGLADRLAVVGAIEASKVLGIPVDDAGTGILSVLVFGAGTNYALLLVSRYKDELRLEENRYVAMSRAWRGVSESLISAASTVMLGLGSLLLSIVPTTRGLGLAGIVGIATALFFALFVLPATLVSFGRNIFWPLVPRVGDKLSGQREGIWYRISAIVIQKPMKVLSFGLIALFLGSIGVTQIETGLSQNERFLNKPESVAAQERVAEQFSAGFTDPIEILTPVENRNEVFSQVRLLNGVTTVIDGKSNGEFIQLDVISDLKPGSAESYDLVEKVRDQLANFDQTYVGGNLAREMDVLDAAKRDQILIAPIILLLVTFVLILLLRALVAPVLLVISVLATYLASMGLAWWVFKTVFNFPALDSGVPLLAFLFLVALGVDYNIFLIARAKEEAANHSLSDAITRALSSTGGVITSAGVLLAAVFSVLGVLPLITLTQIGIIVGIGVLLDTLLVRTIIVPALAVKTGNLFWWPSRRVRER
jgi:RND superfamily putative drug exporter